MNFFVFFLPARETHTDKDFFVYNSEGQWTLEFCCVIKWAGKFENWCEKNINSVITAVLIMILIKLWLFIWILIN